MLTAVLVTIGARLVPINNARLKVNSPVSSVRNISPRQTAVTNTKANGRPVKEANGRNWLPGIIAASTSITGIISIDTDNVTGCPTLTAESRPIAILPNEPARD